MNRVLIIFIVLFLTVSFNLYTDDLQTEEALDELVGTWANTNYGTCKIPFPQKVINNPDGTLELYAGMADIAHRKGKYNIIDKWTDSEGNVLYKIRRAWGDGTYGEKPDYELHKISNSGLTWEFVFSMDEYPTEINPNHPFYMIYYRQ